MQKPAPWTTYVTRAQEALRGAVMGSRLESSARFVWKKLLRQKSQNDIYNLQTVAIMEAALRADSNGIDIGCHKGEFLDHMLRLAPRGAHYAFEPLPSLARELQRSYARHANVVVSGVALSNISGDTTFHANKDHPEYSGIRRRDYLSESDRVDLIRVKTERLDDVVAEEHRIAFIKMDVEGAEYLVFEGARERLRRDRPIVVFEHGTASRDYYGHATDELFDLLHQCGLRVSLLEEFSRSGPSLTRGELVHQVAAGLNFYFVAHP